MLPERRLRAVPPPPLEPEPEDRPLWPEIVEEDFVEVSGIVRRYAARQGLFSMVEIEDHLLANDVLLPEADKDWKLLFDELKDAVVADFAVEGDERLWVTEKFGRVTKYALAQVLRAETLKSQAPVPEPEPPKPVAKPAVASGGGSDVIAKAAVQALFRAAGTPLLRPDDILKGLSNDDPIAAQQLFSQAVEAGQLVRVSRKGTVYYGPAELHKSRPTQKTERLKTSDAQTETHPITQEELQAAVNIMDRLTAPGTHVNQGATIKVLEQAFGVGFSKQDFRKILRALEAQRLVTISAAANYGKARKSPRVTLRGQDTKARWQSNRDGYINRLQKITIV